jgi:hypothetical protein
MSSIPTTSFDPLMPESLENRWIDYYSGRETSPYCDGSAVNMPFKTGTPLYASDLCPPGVEGALETDPATPGEEAPAPVPEAPPTP